MRSLAELRARFVVERPDSIRDKVAGWAFEDAETLGDVFRRLESIDCAACHSPAPVYYLEMAEELARQWPEIDAAVDGYRDATGESWRPPSDHGVLAYVWFAYEWAARELADEIRNALSAEPERQSGAETPVLHTGGHLPSPGDIANDNEPHLPGRGPEHGRRR